MRKLVLLLALAAAVARADTSCPTQAPNANYLYPSASCGSSVLCAAGQQAIMTVAARIPECPIYPYGCPPPYQIQPCDTVTWHFGDGTPDATVTGNTPLPHTYAKGGLFFAYVTIANTLGTAITSAPLYVTTNPPSVVSAVIPNVAEDAGSVTMTLTRSGNLNMTSNIEWGTPCNCGINGGTNASSYGVAPALGSVTFAPGETTKTVTLTIVNDHLYGGDVQQQVQLEAYDGTTFADGTRDTFLRFTVYEVDTPPSVTIDDTSILEGDSGTTLANFNVHLSKPMAVSAYINFATQDGTATAGQDYDPVRNGTSILIPAGQTTASFGVPIHGDVVPEDDEWFSLNVVSAGANNGMQVLLPIARGTARGTILNDDYYVPQSLRTYTGEHATITFDAGHPFDTATTIPLSVTAPSVISIPASLSIPAGKQSATIDVSALSAGTASIVAQLPPSHRSVAAAARVEVVDRIAINSDPASLTLVPDATADVTLSIAPPRASGTTLTVAASDATLLDLPSSLFIPAGGTATLPVHALHRGAGSIFLTEPSSGTTAAVAVDVLNLHVDDAQPRSGAPEGGSLVTISGTHLDAPCAVTFGAAAGNVLDANGTTLHVLVPAHPVGDVDLTITCGSDQVTLPHAFTYVRGRRRAVP